MPCHAGQLLQCSQHLLLIPNLHLWDCPLPSSPRHLLPILPPQVTRVCCCPSLSCQVATSGLGHLRCSSHDQFQTAVKVSMILPNVKCQWVLVSLYGYYWQITAPVQSLLSATWLCNTKLILEQNSCCYHNVCSLVHSLVSITRNEIFSVYALIKLKENSLLHFVCHKSLSREVQLKV